jgi:hypothetical protein
LKQDIDAVIDVLEVMEENAHVEPEFTTGSDYIERRVKKEFDGSFMKARLLALQILCGRSSLMVMKRITVGMT